MSIEAGQCYRVFYSAGNPNNRLLHVRAIVDDRVVTRTWSPRRQEWMYAIDYPVEFFQEQIDRGTFKRVAERSEEALAR